jgi:hypothetical protein
LKNFFDSDQSVSSPCLSHPEQAALANRRHLLASVALDVVVGQLPVAQLPLDDQLIGSVATRPNIRKS